MQISIIIKAHAIFRLLQSNYTARFWLFVRICVDWRRWYTLLNFLTLNAIFKLNKTELDRWWAKWWVIPFCSPRWLYIQNLEAENWAPFGVWPLQFVQYCPSLRVAVSNELPLPFLWMLVIIFFFLLCSRRTTNIETSWTSQCCRQYANSP